MRRSLALGLLVLACRSGIKAPETIPVAPGVLDSIPPAIALAAVDTSARAAVQAGTPSRALIAADWPLTQRVTPVPGEHATRATRDMYVDTAGNAIGSSLTGHRSVGVPGTVAGMYEAHRRFGRLPWKELLVPAIALARDGYLLDGPRSHVIEREAERLGRFP